MKSTKDPYPRVSIRLPDKLKSELASMANKDSRKLSDYMRKVLRNHVQTVKVGGS